LMMNNLSLASMFQKQQTPNDLKKTREAYNAMFESWKLSGLDEAAHAEPDRCIVQKTTHIPCLVESDTVDATVPKRSVNPSLQKQVED
jgi:hypothetical protein